MVRAYLGQHLRNRQADIGRIVSAHTTPRARILAVFAELEVSEAESAEYRAWLLNLFTENARAAGARRPGELGRRLLMLYDGGAVAARMDHDRAGAARAMHSAAVALLDSAT